VISFQFKGALSATSSNTPFELATGNWKLTSSMLPDLERLIRLQDIETRAAAARKRIADAPAEIAALDARLTAAHDAVAAARQAQADNQTARRALDKDVTAAQQRLGKYKEQLMEVKTNIEYHAMQHQIEAATAEVGRIEEQILVNMLQADETVAALKAAEARLKSDEAALAKERAAIQADAAEKETVVADCERDREALRGEIDRVHLDLFDRVFRARQGLAVAQAVNGHCTICHVRLRPQVYNTIIKNDSIVQCDSCQRVLYFAGVRERSAEGQAALDAAHARQTEHERPSP
jgi:predicted  nucleic acid-binding Zn-ribbon protein